MNTIQVVAAVVDSTQLTLYKTDGNTVVIPQGDKRLAEILKTITPILVHPGAVAEVDLSHNLDNVYKDYEESSNGVIRFFRVAKSKLSRLFGRKVEAEAAEAVSENTVLGTVPRPGASIPVLIPDWEKERAARMQEAVNEIIANATPATSPNFHDQNLTDVTAEEGDTLVAVVNEREIVPHVQSLRQQVARASSLKDFKGFGNFMKRVAAVATKRGHSAEDLMRFMERGDLPIADDGSIVIYKVLNTSSRGKGEYVDRHTKRVTQKVGSYVCMDESLVDPNRRNECSNGLHVARRAYISSFSGDVCVLAKVAPEDVIAVPDYDANKMRVCGYHILFELPQNAFERLKKNQPFTENNKDAQLMLGRALSGDHVGRLEMVKIHGHNGKDVKITPLVVNKSEAKAKAQTPAQKAAEPPKQVKPAEALPEPEAETKAPAVDPKQVANAVKAEKAQHENQMDKAKRLYDVVLKAKSKADKAAAARELLDFKKSSKKGWLALNLDPNTGEQLNELLKK